MSKITTDLTKIIVALNADDVVAIPTETVYGLAGNIYSENAIKQIFKLKSRPLYNPLIVHISSIEQLSLVAKNIPGAAYDLANAFWPGPLTLLLEKQESIPDLVTSGKQTVAVRVPQHPLALSLLQQLTYPLAAPSANPFGSISPTSAIHVDDYFKDNLSYILDGGQCDAGIESTIVGFEDSIPVIYRLGAITMEEIGEIVGLVNVLNKQNHNPKAPGMLSSHYAPATKFLLCSDIRAELANFTDSKVGLLLFDRPEATAKSVIQEVLSPAGNIREAATKLYATLHKLDKMNLDIIIGERFPDEGLGQSINDRLERASYR